MADSSFCRSTADRWSLKAQLLQKFLLKSFIAKKRPKLSWPAVTTKTAIIILGKDEFTSNYIKNTHNSMDALNSQNQRQ